MSEFGGTYSTGTISISSGSTALGGNGTLWSAVAEEGDWILAGNGIGLVDSVNSDTSITLKNSWPVSTQSYASYVLLKMSWLRYEPALTQAKVRELLTVLATVGIMYYVSGTAPDDAVGNDGDFAVKLNTTPWRFWTKQGGSWTLLGNPAGIAWRGIWSALTQYYTNDVVHRLGVSYIAKQSNYGQDPQSDVDATGSGTYWDLFVVGGSRVELWFGDNDQPVSGEEIFEGVFTATTNFPAGLTESQAIAGDVATADSTLSIRKNGVEFGTLTFAAGATTGTFASAAGATFDPGDKLTIVVPSPRDTTLAKIAATLVGAR